ncbi:protein trichome birefringence-like 19 [Primulina tabacum]|uniref:protein trichome birefringence-like 19 n=1 Tax=Primulina tabacum TaxID=48773 RepID=UPI003F59D8F5
MKFQASEIISGKPQTRKRSPKFLSILIFFILIFTLYFPFFPKKLALPFIITYYDKPSENTIIIADEDESRPPDSGVSSASKPPPLPTTAKADSTAKTPGKMSRKVPNSGDPGTTCDLFSGEWVPNPGGPYYTNTTCQTIQEHQNCMKFGRPDTGFMKWRWRPDDCELPIFDPHKFLELVKGKSLGFVGDSVARNHMQSLICLLSRVVRPLDVSKPTDENILYQYTQYKFNISIISSPYLVRTRRSDPNDITRPYHLYLDEFDETWTAKIATFDFLIISAGHWFFRPTYFYLNRSLAGCLYCSDPNITQMASTFSYRWAFRTAFRAINRAREFKGVVFLRTFAPSHFEGGPWDKGGDCARTAPFGRNGKELEGYELDMYRVQMEELGVAQTVGRRTGVRFRLFDATKPMVLRADGHPSKYGHWPGVNQTIPNDCVHWCLPGPIDSWNDMLQELVRREVVNSNPFS